MIKQIIYTVFTLTLFLTSLNAQKSENQFDNNGKRHGFWTKDYYQTNQKRYEGTFKHGKEIDSFKFYTLSGGKSVLSAVKIFNEKDSIADVKFFASNKKVISEGRMDGKRFVEKWVFYHKNSLEKMIVENYNSEGLLSGERFVYYLNGVLAESAHYKDGKLDGEAKWFSEQNKLLRHTFYKKDQLDGKTLYYGPDGIITSEGNYVMDQKKGVWKYYKDGKVTKEVDHTTQEVISKKE
ncbi:toxin-antitoxin system YwqK family antitoxin [Winogradskyella wichelsiae]|uniref:toxin-antitoxin system YwqK family antitoxin n=1 Tax=Winogradskyella wichelsiae TaxID=2697007 RepID=UPI003EF3B55E